MSDSTISSSVDVPSTGSYQMSQDEKREAMALYQNCPTLWTDFRNIADCVDALGDPSVPWEELHDKLITVFRSFQCKDDSEGPNTDLCNFSVVTGFVDLAVACYRRTLREMGRTYMTKFCPPFTSTKEQFLVQARGHFLNCSLRSPQFCRRLIQTGFVTDMVEDLTHAQHMSSDALEKSKVILISMGTLANICQHHETEALLKEMQLTAVITPYLHKHSEEVKSICMALLSHLVTDDQLDLMRMDSGLVQYFMDNIAEAVDTEKRIIKCWELAEMLSTLVLLVRCDFNNKSIVAHGISQKLVSVLDPKTERDEKEKRNVIKLLLELSKDRDNLWVFQTDKRLRRFLDGLKSASGQVMRDLAIALTSILDNALCEDSSESENMPHVAALLTDQLNILVIMDVSPVHFVLDQLTTPQPQGAGPGNSRVRVLRALAELAQRGGHYRREVMATGGLAKLKNVLQTSRGEEQTEALKVIIELVSSDENRTIFKNQPWFITLLQTIADKTAAGGVADSTNPATKLLSILSEQQEPQPQSQTKDST